MKDKGRADDKGEKHSFKYEDTSPLTNRQFKDLRRSGVKADCEYQEDMGKTVKYRG